MKYLQKVTKTLVKGKVEKEEKGAIKAIVDSTGDSLVIEGEQEVKAWQEDKKSGVITVWEESTKAAKTAQEKKAGRIKEEKKAPSKEAK